MKCPISVEEKHTSNKWPQNQIGVRYTTFAQTAVRSALLSVVSMNRSEGHFDALAGFFRFMHMLCRLRLVEVNSLFPSCIVFLSIWKSLSCTCLFNAAFEVWALFAGILKEGGEGLSALINKPLERALWPCLKKDYDERNVLYIYFI